MVVTCKQAGVEAAKESNSPLWTAPRVSLTGQTRPLITSDQRVYPSSQVRYLSRSVASLAFVEGDSCKLPQDETLRQDQPRSWLPMHSIKEHTAVRDRTPRSPPAVSSLLNARKSSSFRLSTGYYSCRSPTRWTRCSEWRIWPVDGRRGLPRDPGQLCSWARPMRSELSCCHANCCR